MAHKQKLVIYSKMSVGDDIVSAKIFNAILNKAERRKSIAIQIGSVM